MALIIRAKLKPGAAEKAFVDIKKRLEKSKKDIKKTLESHPDLEKLPEWQKAKEAVENFEKLYLRVLQLLFTRARGAVSFRKTLVSSVSFSTTGKSDQWSEIKKAFLDLNDKLKKQVNDKNITDKEYKNLGIDKLVSSMKNLDKVFSNIKWTISRGISTGMALGQLKMAQSLFTSRRFSIGAITRNYAALKLQTANFFNLMFKENIYDLDTVVDQFYEIQQTKKIGKDQKEIVNTWANYLGCSPKVFKEYIDGLAELEDILKALAYSLVKKASGAGFVTRRRVFVRKMKISRKGRWAAIRPAFENFINALESSLNKEGGLGGLKEQKPNITNIVKEMRIDYEIIDKGFLLLYGLLS